MTVGTILALALAALVAVFVLAPLFRADAAQEERRAARQSEEEDLLSQREMTMGAIRDLEDDRATGKIGEEDYRSGKAELTARAVDLLKRLDEIEGKKAAPRPEAITPPGRS